MALGIHWESSIDRDSVKIYTYQRAPLLAAILSLAALHSELGALDRCFDPGGTGVEYARGGADGHQHTVRGGAVL